MSVLTTIILLPLIGALALLFIPARQHVVVRMISCGVTLLSFILASLTFFEFNAADGSGFRNEQLTPWVESLGIQYHVGLDGINVGVLLMAAAVGFSAVLVAKTIQYRAKEFHILLLVMIGGVLGAFASLDLFFFYFFHELALIPTFVMIGLWGRGENRNYVTFKVTLYLSLGALIALVGLILLYVQAGANSFDIVKIAEAVKANPLSFRSQNLIFPFLLFGFGILVSLWPFHTWAPMGYGAAPTATAMVHAGALKKFGLYGLIRIALPILPDAAAYWAHIIAWLCLGNLLYCGWVAMRQKNLNLVIGNSSVAHMGFVFLGIASLSLLGVTGAITVMIAHGFLAALSFGLTGYLADRGKSLELDQMGGILKSLPAIGSFMVLAFMAGCGLPGFANFVGEVMVLFGSWSSFSVVTSFGVWAGLVIGAIYMLRALRKALHGPLNPSYDGILDASGFGQKLPYLILIAFLTLFGVFPRLLTDKVQPAVERSLEQMKESSSLKVVLVTPKGPAQTVAPSLSHSSKFEETKPEPNKAGQS